MKTVDRITGAVCLTLANGTTEQALIMSADPLGVWTEDAFIPWAAIDRIEVA